MTPEDEARLAQFKETVAARYAAFLEDPEGKMRAYGAAMVALAFCASEEGFPRFRRWLTERPQVHGLEDGQRESLESWTQHGVQVASKVFAGWTICEQDKGSSQEAT